MGLFSGSKKDDGVNNILPTARDVVRAIAREEAEEVNLREKVQKLEVKEIVKDEIRKDNIYEALKEKDQKIAMLEKKVEELQAKNPVPR
ncbi:hypothetical protein ACO3VM_02785 [Methanocaldococcus sp. 10A]